MLRLRNLNSLKSLTQNVTQNFLKKPVVSGIGCSSGALCFALITPQKRIHKTDAIQTLDTQNSESQKSELHSKKSKFTLADLWEFLKTHKTTLAVSILCALAAAYFNIQIPICLGSLVDSVASFLRNEQPLSSKEFWDVIMPKVQKLFGLYSLQSVQIYKHLLIHSVSIQLNFVLEILQRQ